MDSSHVELSATPIKRTTRGQRVNYNELNSSGQGFEISILEMFFSDNDDAVFRSPKSTTRGIKRRNDEAFATPATV